MNIEDNMSNTTQVALVTGGGRGLGRAFAQVLAAHGMVVAVTSRTKAELDETVVSIVQAGGHALAFAGDVTDAQSVNSIVATVTQQLGPIDVLVNNAGLFRAVDLFYKVDPAAWWRDIDVNVRGPYLFARAVAPSMIERKHGRIINVASGAGTAAVAGASAYCISKAAIIRLTEVMALELRDAGVAVLAYDPGTVRTHMTEHLIALPQTAQFQPWLPKLFAEKRDVPLEKSARALLAMATGATDGLSGCMIDVDDDVPALVEQREAILRDGRRVLRMNQ